MLHEIEPIQQEFLKNRGQAKPSIFLNETGLDNSQKIDFILPELSVIKSMEDYRKALNDNGFDIKIANRTLDFLVITDNSRQ
ncbi:hypothetical protein D3C87_1870270 [compost metagenome]